MINFRYHLVSLIAVFLALALGIALGATVVDKGTLDLLRHKIKTVKDESDRTSEANRTLAEAEKQLRDYVDDTSALVVQGRLTGVPVAVFAVRGVDGDAVKELVSTLQDAGAEAPAIIWLEAKWQLPDEASRRDLAAAVGTAVQRDPVASRADALAALAARLAPLPAVATSSTTTTATAVASDVLQRLSEAGFVAIEAAGAGGSNDLAGFPGPSARAVVVLGSNSTSTPADLSAAFATALADADIATTVAEAFVATEGGAQRGAALASIRSEHSLDGVVSTVDDLDLAQGRVAVALALGALAQGVAGHFGYGQGATRSLPPP